MKMGFRVKSVVGGIRCYQGSNLYFSTEHSRIKNKQGPVLAGPGQRRKKI